MKLDQQTKVAIITVATPMIIAMFKLMIPKIPKQLLPVIAPVIGGLIDGLASASGLHESSPMLSVIAGSAGVGLRELFDQFKASDKTTPPPTSIIVASIIGAQLFLGCASYTNIRSMDPKTSVVTETTRVRAPFLTKSTVEGLKTHVSDRVDKNGVHSYNKSLGLTNASNEADVEGIKAFQALIGQSLLEALKKTTP